MSFRFNHLLIHSSSSIENTLSKDEIVQPQHQKQKKIRFDPIELQSEVTKVEDRSINNYSLVRDRERRLIRPLAIFGVVDLIDYALAIV